MIKKTTENYEAPLCTPLQMEASGVLAASYTFGNHALGIDENNTIEYNPEWF